MNFGKILTWGLQLVVSGILIMTSWAKLSSKPISIIIFSELGMEPTGRYIIGVVELTAAVCLLTNRLAATGALLAVGTMLGAIIAHVTILGYDVQGDHGRHIIMLAVVFISSVSVLILRRRQIPLVGFHPKEKD